MPQTNWTPAEISRKLADIARLPADELPDWHRYCTGLRQPFPGEIDALDRRARSLGLILTERGYSLPSGKR